MSKGETVDEEMTKQKKQKENCVGRESNPGPVDGNDGFYH